MKFHIFLKLWSISDSIIELNILGSYHEDYGKKKGGSFKKGHKKGFELFFSLNSMDPNWINNYKILKLIFFRYHEEKKGEKKGGGKKGHNDEDKKGMQTNKFIIIWILNNIPIPIYYVIYIFFTIHK